MILFLDCASGASGDMLAAALADLAGRLGHDAGAEVARVLAAVGIDAAVVRLSPTRRGGLMALTMQVDDGPGFATFAELTAAVASSGLSAGRPNAWAPWRRAWRRPNAPCTAARASRTCTSSPAWTLPSTCSPPLRSSSCWVPSGSSPHRRRSVEAA